MRGFLAALAAIGVVMSGAAHAAPPAAAYGALPTILSAAVSPDGTRIAMLRENGGRYVLTVDDLATMENVSATPPGKDITFRDVAWGNNDFVLVTSTVTFNPAAGRAQTGSFIRTQGQNKLYSYEYGRLLSFAADGSQGRPLLHYSENSAELLNLTQYWPAHESDPGSILMFLPRFVSSAYTYTIQRVDLATGADTSVYQGSPTTRDFIINREGDLVGRVEYDENSGAQKLMAKQAGGGMKEIWRLSSSKTEALDVYAASSTLSDGRLVVVAPGEVDGDDDVYAVNPETGEKEVISQTAGDYLTDPNTGEVVGVRQVDEFSREKFFPADLIAVQAAIAPNFRQGFFRLASWDKAHETFVVTGENAGSPTHYYVYSTKTKALTDISSVYPSVTGAAIGQRVALKYKARDATPIHAYLTLPSGATGPAKYPAVVLVHGGPAARDTFAFDWWASFLASRGYAVLQPNYRGSSGYGAAWEQAGYRQWGGLMQTDVADGVNAMIKAGYFDPARVCIVGASYGGYAALTGAALTPDLYRCAISVAGVSDLPDFLDRNFERYGDQSLRVTSDARQIGDRKTVAGREQLKSISPIALAGQIKAPVLLMHGPQDTVVPINQSRDMQKALTNAGKSVRFVELAGDDHWLSYGATRTQVLEEMDKFLAENLKK